jgi:hypothetical protein
MSLLKHDIFSCFILLSRKIQNYSPTDVAKVNDKPITSRKTNFKFNPKQIMEYLRQSNKVMTDDDDVKFKLAQEYVEVCFEKS